jgi:hypothetical protein
MVKAIEIREKINKLAARSSIQKNVKESIIEGIERIEEYVTEKELEKMQEFILIMSKARISAVQSIKLKKMIPKILKIIERYKKYFSSKQNYEDEENYDSEEKSIDEDEEISDEKVKVIKKWMKKWISNHSN